MLHKLLGNHALSFSSQPHISEGNSDEYRVQRTAARSAWRQSASLDCRQSRSGDALNQRVLREEDCERSRQFHADYPGTVCQWQVHERLGEVARDRASRATVYLCRSPDNAIATQHNAIVLPCNPIVSRHNAIVLPCNSIASRHNAIVRTHNGIVSQYNAIAGIAE
jgi:hypothetical protein